jgi:hypothetical protein
LFLSQAHETVEVVPPCCSCRGVAPRAADAEDGRQHLGRADGDDPGSLLTPRTVPRTAPTILSTCLAITILASVVVTTPSAPRPVSS